MRSSVAEFVEHSRPDGNIWNLVLSTWPPREVLMRLRLKGSSIPSLWITAGATLVRQARREQTPL